MKLPAMILSALCGTASAQTSLADVPCLPVPFAAQSGWEASPSFDWQVTVNGAWIDWSCYEAATGRMRTFTYAAIPSRYSGAVLKLRAAMANGTLIDFVRSLPATNQVEPITAAKFAAINADRAAFYAAQASAPFGQP